MYARSAQSLMESTRQEDASFVAPTQIVRNVKILRAALNVNPQLLARILVARSELAVLAAQIADLVAQVEVDFVIPALRVTMSRRAKHARFVQSTVRFVQVEHVLPARPGMD